MIDLLKKHLRRPFFLLVCAELAILLVLLGIAIVTPAASLNADGFHFAADESLISEEGVLQLEGDPVKLRSVQTHALASGAYNVCIRYVSDTNGMHYRPNAAAALSIDSDYFGPLLQTELHDGSTILHERLYIPLYKSCDDLTMTLSYQSGSFELHSVSITENIAYRFVCLTGLALLFALGDLVLRLFFLPGRKISAKGMRILALFALALFASLPFLGNYLPAGHDLYFHLSRIFSLAEEMNNCQLPVRIFTGQHNDYGYPSPLYYCALFLYIPAMLYNSMLSLEACYVVYMLLVNLFTCFISYSCFARMTRFPMLATALYSLNLYRLINLYTRAALGEYTAMIFLPLVLLGMYQIYTKEKPALGDWLPLSLGMCGIVCSHILTTELVVLNLIAVCVILCKRTFKPLRLLAIVKAALLCLLLCAWFWVPFLDSYLSQAVSVQTKPVRFIQNGGLYLTQLMSFFTSGYGNSEPSMYQDMPLSLGGGIVIAFVCILYVLIRQGSVHTLEYKQTSSLRLVFFFLLCNILPAMEFFPWSKLQSVLGVKPGQLGSLIEALQFPWRFLMIVVPLAVLGGMWALAHLQSISRTAFRLFFCAMAAGLLISASFYQYQYTNAALPRDVNELVNSSLTQVDTLYLFNPDDLSVSSVSACTVSDPEHLTVQNYRKENGIATAHVRNSANTAGTLTVPIFGYNHYAVTDENGNEFFWTRGDQNRIAVQIPAHYQGKVCIRFQPPLYWRAAEMVSLTALLGMLGFGIYYRRKHARILAAE